MRSRGAYPLSRWLSQYLDGKQNFTTFSRQAVEHLQKLMGKQTCPFSVRERGAD